MSEQLARHTRIVKLAELRDTLTRIGDHLRGRRPIDEAATVELDALAADADQLQDTPGPTDAAALRDINQRATALRSRANRERDVSLAELLLALIVVTNTVARAGGIDLF